jgi:hypothetical protein
MYLLHPFLYVQVRLPPKVATQLCKIARANCDGNSVLKGQWVINVLAKHTVWLNNNKTIPKITINRWYKQFPNGLFVIVLSTLKNM